MHITSLQPNLHQFLLPNFSRSCESMATSNNASKTTKEVREMEREITCPVCHNHFQEPKILPCCHYYCKGCIQKLAVRAGTNQPFPCPECRSDTLLPGNDPNQLPTAFFVNRMKELHTKMVKAYGKVEALCEQCSGNKVSVAFCRQCAEFICFKCSEAHKTMKTFARHKIVSMEDLKKGGTKQVSVADRSPPPICSIHEEVLKMYCYDCDCLICRDCIVIDHKEHNCEFVKKAALETKQKLAQQLSPLKRVQASVSDSLKTISSTKASIESQGVSVTETIERSFQELCNIINQRKRELLAQASSLTSGKLCQLSTQEDKLRVASGTIQKLVDFAEHNVERMTDEELMSIQVQLLKQIKEEMRKHLHTSTNVKPTEKANMAVVVGCTEELRKLCRDETRLLVSTSQKVVWVDPKIDNSENSSYVDYLRSVEGIHLHTTSDPNDAIEQLSKVQSGIECRAITAGTGGIEFVQKMRKMGILCPVLVFTSDEERHNKWACGYDNIKVTTSPIKMYEFATWNRYTM